MDEYTRECLLIDVARRLGSQNVLDRLTELCSLHGVPEHVRSDNGPEFTAKAVRRWLEGLEGKPLYIEPGSPWENGYIESFNGKLRDERPNRESCLHIDELRYVVDHWRMGHNQYRPHPGAPGLGRINPAAFAATAQNPGSPAGHIAPGCPSDFGPRTKKELVGKTLIRGRT